MTPGLRPLTAAATLTGALLLTPLPYTVAVGTPSPGPPTTAVPSRSPNSSPSAQPSPPVASGEQRLAGSKAGEGRTRPGRVSPSHDLLPYPPDTELPDAVRPAQQEAVPETPPQAPVPEPPEPPEPSEPSPSEPPATPAAPAPTSGAALPPNGHHHQATQTVTTGSDLRFHVLSLGAGLALTGLGLGFLGLRLRRP
ncbi:MULTISPECIES: hypothetical protein [unclassified Streptomyces]|uniref:hypothetical protein n=1 Tax=unclassified Streptomyces TaxID=2593676 RepID=UPI00380ACD9C